MDDLTIRPGSASRAVTIAYGLIVALPMGFGLTAGVFFLMSYRPVQVPFVLGAVVCAVVGPLLLILLPLGLKAAANIKLVLTPTELCLVNESGGQGRSIPRAEISGVWRVTLPPGVTVSDVPALPKKVVLIEGSGQNRPILLHGEWRRSDLESLWRQLGHSPVDAGKMRKADLNERFPGATESISEMATGAGVWFRVYLAGVVALLIYVAAVTVGSLPQ